MKTLNNENFTLSMHEKLNYFIERSLFIEIKEARNLTTLMSNSNEISSLNTLHHHHHHHSLSKQMSAPLPSLKTDDNVNQELFKNYYFYCLILLNNDILIAKTKNIQNNLKKSLIQMTPDLIWNENFTYENIPLDITSFKLLIFATKNVSLSIDTIITSMHTTPTNTSTNSSLLNMLKFRNTNNIICVGEVNVSLLDLLNKGLDEKWYKIDALKHESDSTVRLQIRFNEEKILYNLYDYHNLQTYLSNSVEELCAIYLSMGTERSELKLNLIKFYINQTQLSTQKQQQQQNQPIIESELRLLDTLKLFLNYEIENCTDLSTLFRSTTLTTSLMDYYMRSKTKQYLQRCVYEPFIKILKQTKRQQKSFELDTSKFESQMNPQAQLELNLQHFKKSLTVLVESICQQTLTYFPIELVYLFQFIRQKVTEKWSTAANLKYARVYCISSFIFLRLICPFLMNLNSAALILNSDENGDTSTNTATSPNTSNGFLNERYIKLIAKVLQTSANLTECKKEPFMQPLSEYLSEIRNSIVKFIDFISNYDDLAKELSIKQQPNYPADECDSRINLSKNLAYLHRLFKTFSIKQHELYLQHEKEDLDNNHKQLISKNILAPLIQILNEINVKID
jgi:hypothetical protein